MSANAITYGLAELPSAASSIIAACDKKLIWLIDAPMGAGKTTVIREICHQLGVRTDVTSPTYSIVNEYVSDLTHQTIYHLDLYRLQSIGEALDLGIEEYLHSGKLCIIEWPDVISPITPKDISVRIKIEIINPDYRAWNLV